MLHAYRWPNGGPARARRPQATALAQARHVGLLTVPGRPLARRLIWLNQRKMLKNNAEGGVWTHALMKEGWETMGEAILPVEHYTQMFLILNINCIYVYMFFVK
jgi:hypothetical protein